MSERRGLPTERQLLRRLRRATFACDTAKAGLPIDAPAQTKPAFAKATAGNLRIGQSAKGGLPTEARAPTRPAFAKATAGNLRIGQSAEVGGGGIRTPVRRCKAEGVLRCIAAPVISPLA